MKSADCIILVKGGGGLLPPTVPPGPSLMGLREGLFAGNEQQG